MSEQSLLEGNGVNESVRFYVKLDPELAQLLSAHDVELGELLVRQTDIERYEIGTDPAHAGSKSAEMILIASAAVILSATPIILAAIQALSHRPIIAKNLVLVDEVDGEGRVLVNKDGSARKRWVEQTQIIESRSRTETTKFEGSASGMLVKFDSKSHD